MTADATLMTGPVTGPDPVHVAELAAQRTQAGRIRYACDQVRRQTPDPTTAEVRAWLDRYGIAPTRSYAHTVVTAWRREQGLADTGGMPVLTSDVLAELDAAAGVQPGGDCGPEMSCPGTGQHPAGQDSSTPDSGHRPDVSSPGTGHHQVLSCPPADGQSVSDADVLPGQDTSCPADEHPAGVSSAPAARQDVAAPVTAAPQDIGDRTGQDTGHRPGVSSARVLSGQDTSSPGTEHVTADPADAAPATEPVSAGPVSSVARPRGLVVAWLSFVVGGLVSVAANIAHTLYPTATQLAAWTAAGRPAAEWRPEAGAMVGAAFWPVALILAVEVLTRVDWRPGFLFGLARYGGTTLVAIVAAVMSYRHMSELLLLWGEDALGAHLGPLAVDGLMVVSAAALLSMTRNKRP